MSIALFAGGLLLGVALGAWLVLAVHRWKQVRGRLVEVDVPQVLDLLRRVHGALATCLIMDDDSSAMSVTTPRPDTRLLQRAVATARLAMGDSRQHIVNGRPQIVALGDGHIGAAVVLSREGTDDTLQRVTADLKRLLAGARVRLLSAGTAGGDPRRGFDSALARLDSVESLSVGLCEAARTMTALPTAVVLRDPVTSLAAVSAISRGADRKLVGLRVSAESAAGRAVMAQVPIVGLSITELLGAAPDARRRSGEAGVAYPLSDGREGIGALIVFGRPENVSPERREEVAALAAQISPHMAAAAAIRAAETRAVTDQLTGLPNRGALERSLSQVDGQAALLMVDLDHFKKLNDGFGHAAGDAALKLMANVFARTLREGDVAARVGGEEFALLLRGADPRVAMEVAERVRRATADTRLVWAGAELGLSCSVGVAAYPDPIRDVANLLVAADAALYRAKQAGRNQVAMATQATAQA